MRPPRLRAIALSLAVALGAGTARADDAEARRAEAKRLKDRGAEALDRGRYQDALDQFQAAYRAFPSPNLEFDLGLALAGIGRSVEAVRRFEAFLDEAKDAPEMACSYARREVARLADRIGRIDVRANVAGTDVAVDGRRVGDGDEAATPFPPRALRPR